MPPGDSCTGRIENHWVGGSRSGLGTQERVIYGNVAFHTGSNRKGSSTRDAEIITSAFGKTAGCLLLAPE